jgi:hypothetical protein
MRSTATLLLALVSCSSASTLPSGGPFGGNAGDAGVTIGTEGRVDSGATSSGGLVFVVDAASASASASSTRSGPPPTWTYLYDTYLTTATSTIGSCDSLTCHAHTQCSTAAACYTWIGTGAQGNLSGGGGNALFTWEGGAGYMPEDGPLSDPQAEADFAAWVAAGSPDN